MTLSLVLAVVGTIAGLTYAALGLRASSHLRNKAESESPDRFLMAGLLWSFDTSKFDTEGRSLARVANFALVIGSLAWVGWAFIR